MKRGVIVVQHSGSVTVLKWGDTCYNDFAYCGVVTQSELKRGKEKEKPVEYRGRLNVQLLQPM
jgi:hypothetical protein